MKIGLVNNLARPGGNITGMSHMINALSSKRLGLLRELVPTASTFGLLVDPTNPNAQFETADMMQAAVDLLGYKLMVGSASTGSEVDRAFTNLGSRLIKSTIQERRLGRLMPSNCGPACRIALRCV